jgi:hypothetical protein
MLDECLDECCDRIYFLFTTYYLLNRAGALYRVLRKALPFGSDDNAVHF